MTGIIIPGGAKPETPEERLAREQLAMEQQNEVMQRQNLVNSYRTAMGVLDMVIAAGNDCDEGFEFEGKTIEGQDVQKVVKEAKARRFAIAYHCALASKIDLGHTIKALEE